MRYQSAALTLLTVAVLMLAGCGPEGGDSSTAAGNGEETGQVMFGIQDAPLSQLQSLTIDITGATLNGRQGTPDFQVFPQSGSPNSVTVDLLGLQGFSQLLASANVPSGEYDRLSIEYDNPQATDTSSNPQVIQSPSGRMNGFFQPTLTVAPGSLQSVMIDVDLSLSYQDLGGNEGMLIPVVRLGVVPSGSNMPLERFFARVETVNTAQDTFTAQVVQWAQGGSGGGHLGSVTIECDSATIFKDRQSGITTGGVTSHLSSGNIVHVDGVMTSTAIEASVVSRLSQGSASSGMTTHSSHAPGLNFNPPFNLVTGTLTNVDTTNEEVTVRVRAAIGAQFTPGTDAVIDVDSSASISRGSSTLTLGDLVPGNFCFVHIDSGTGLADDIEESRSFVCGTVTTVSPGAGAGGTDQVEFTPDRVNGIDVSNLPFVPSPLTVDLPNNWPLPQVSQSFCVWAFFEGTSHLTFAHPSPMPPAAPPPVHSLAGTLETGTTAGVNASNELEFSLHAFDGATATMQNFQVTVPAAATIRIFDSGTVTTGTVQDAEAAINANPAIIQAVGSSPPSSLSFTADIALRVVVTNSIPMPPPNPAPPAPPMHDQAFGQVASTATVNSAGDIEFDLQTPPPSSPTVAVTVDQNATITLASAGTVTTLTVAAAVTELNTSPAPFVRVAGTDGGSTFDADVSLTIYR